MVRGCNMKDLIISEKNLDLYCEVKLLNEYNKFLIEFLAKRNLMKGKK